MLGVYSADGEMMKEYLSLEITGLSEIAHKKEVCEREVVLMGQDKTCVPYVSVIKSHYPH